MLTYSSTYPPTQVAFLKKDYDSLKARYYNDTQEVATTGRSNVFIEIMSVVDDFERARMAYKPGGEEEKVKGEWMNDLSLD